jgi:hypothetical protein
MTFASRRRKFQLVFSLVVAAAALLATWLILGTGSPFASYFARHGDLPNVWGLTAALPFVVSAVISHNAHSPSMVMFLIALTVQWLLIGYLLSIPAARLRAHGENNT